MRAGLTLTFLVLITTIALTQDQNNRLPLSCSQGRFQLGDHAVKGGTDANPHPKSDDGCVAARRSLSIPTQDAVASPVARADSSYEPIKAPRVGDLPDFNRSIYYRNKLEFSLDAGYLPINIPFPLDIFVGDAYNTYPLQYTLVPIIASLRWHLDSVGSPWILRGNWDLTFSGSVTAIPRGPESRYFSYDMGIRRNFVQRNW